MTFDPQPANPFGWLIIILLGFLFFVAGVPVSSTTTQALPDVPAGRPARPSVVVPPAGEDRRALLPENGELFGVETIETVVRESFPPQVTLTVSGYWSNGCDAEPQISTVREGDRIVITVFRVIPPDVMCTMVMQRASIDIDISDVFMENGAFRSSEYTITVNGTSTTLKL